MIPRFPIFKPLELSDYTEVAALTRRFPPYSDFNFVSLWSWNISGECRLSTLNGNLVVRLSDYVTNVPFYTFIGDGAPNETVADLARRSNEEGLGGSLRLVPEFMAHRLDKARTYHDMDLDGSDYVLSTARLSRFEGQDYRTKRKEANRFARENPDFRLEHLDLGSSEVANSMLKFFEAWGERKGAPDVFDLAEYKALQRLLRAVDFLPELHGLGVYVRDRLVAFAVVELVQQKHGMGHFLKADTGFAGLYSFLMRQIAEFLESLGYEHLNVQQDLGLPGLRQNKSSYIPSAYLRKYSVAQRATVTHLPPHPSLLSIPAVPHVVLTTGAMEGLGDLISLRAPALSPDLFEMARAEEVEESERVAIRRSRIRSLTEPDTEEHPEPADEQKSTAG